MEYQPNPIDTSSARLTPEILELTERLAEHAHDVWARQRIADGWTFGPRRDDAEKKHPCLVPYAELPDAEKQYDRNAALETLKAITALGYRFEETPSSLATVSWLDRARNKLRRQELIPQLDHDLQSAFQPDGAERITVSDVFAGYRFDEAEKLVLGVQVAGREDTSSHIVKLGGAGSVRRDYEGFSKCLAQHSLASRILLSVRGRELSGGRYAVIYQDAYRLFGADTDAESPKSLEAAVERAVLDGRPDCRSLDRVLAEIYAEMFRCCYHSGREDAARAATFFRDRLEFGGAASAWSCWQRDEFLALRRDALWLVTAREQPEAERIPGYLDPFDFVRWALENGRLPATLVGRSHGDLHGRNILVGLFRGEAVQPAIFDYGDMSDANVLVWDFVKLEMELKCRVLPRLFDVEDARSMLLAAAARVRPPIGGTPRLSIEEQEVSRRVDRLEFAVAFETALAALTHEIVSRDASSRPVPEELRAPTGHAALDRALLLFLRLRQEAAYWLGFQVGRASAWRDEYFFGLAVYGLLTVKWPVERPHLEWALVSAGVATAQLGAHRDPVNGIANQQRRQAPLAELAPKTAASSLVPLAWAHRLWKEKRYDEACALLEQASQRFPHAVALAQESALCLAARGELPLAKSKIETLRRLCHVFRDYETLCRLGRILKDSGDDACSTGRPKYHKFVAERPLGWQLYREAQQLYSEAFEFSRHYYPGGNAATLLLLTGDPAAEELAREVIQICQNTSVANLEARFWLSATAGEAYLVLGRRTQARGHFAAAFENPIAKQAGMLQPVYDQLCRLRWALGTGMVKRIMENLTARGLLDLVAPGPFEKRL